MEETFNSTPFDAMLQNRSIQMLKTIIPYAPSQQQRTLSILVKYMELGDTIAFFDNSIHSMEICSEASPEENTIKMMSELRAFCTEKEKETLDNILNFFQMFSMYDVLFTSKGLVNES